MCTVLTRVAYGMIVYQYYCITLVQVGHVIGEMRPMPLFATYNNKSQRISLPPYFYCLLSFHQDQNPVHVWCVGVNVDHHRPIFCFVVVVLSSFIFCHVEMFPRHSFRMCVSVNFSVCNFTIVNPNTG